MITKDTPIGTRVFRNFDGAIGTVVRILEYRPDGVEDVGSVTVCLDKDLDSGQALWSGTFEAWDLADGDLDEAETVCTYRSSWTDSGDRGADMADHMRAAHPDHTHAWGDSSYDWEQAGEPYIVPLSGGVRGVRPETVQRCTICHIREAQVIQCP